MKKNKALKAALSVFALTMMSMCAIGGTFAKYVTKDSDQDTARVAKWGVTVTVTGDTTNTVLDTNGGAADEQVIVSSSTDEVIAPGTKGTLLTMSVAGDPEVDVEIDCVPTVTINEHWMVDGKFYCPLEFTIKETGESDVLIKGLDHSTAESLKGALEAAINSFDDAEVTTEETLDKTLSVEWEWAFSGGTGTINQTDELDSKLGSYTTAPKVTINANVTVSQLD